MSTIGHYDQAELALFAMQLLSEGEHAAIATHLVGCAYCRQELAQLQGDLAALAHIVEMHSPPSQVRERFLQQVAHEQKLAPTVSTETNRTRISGVTREERQELVENLDASVPSFGRPKKQRMATSSRRYQEGESSTDGEQTPMGRFFGQIFPWIGWGAAAGMAIAAGNLYHQREVQRTRLAAQASTIEKLSADAAAARQLLETITDSSARQVTLTRSVGEAPPAVPLGHATYVAAKGALVFFASNLEPLDSYKTYELWLIPANDRDPIPAGTFKPDTHGNASVILPPLPKGIDAKAFGVTVEDEGGSQTPTMPIMLAGS